MPGPCAECSKTCYQKADDGKYYCDACWHAWQTGTLRPKANKAADERLAKESSKLAAVELREKQYWKARQEAARLDPEPLEASSDGPLSVAFWGICDLKYDPRLPEKDRIKVLELGDGRSSRFSHHGAAIKEKFDAMFCMDAHPIKRAVLVENKKLTHDTFVDCGLTCLRPLQFSYPRRYDSGLASRIKHDLGLTEGVEQNAVVLKLVNRSRGAGVVVCPVEELDATLQELLRPPQGKQLDAWLKEHAPQALTEDRLTDLLAEHKLHFWSNECPVFVAEQLCRSMPVQSECFRAGEDFDGTLRVAFALRRRDDAETLDNFTVDWLGGYWKLPTVPVSQSGSSNMAEVHRQSVSSFNSEDKRTAQVAPQHLAEIYSALTPALRAVFAVDLGGAKDIMRLYRDDTNFQAYLLTRYCASVRMAGLSALTNSTKILDQAKKLVRHPGNLRPSDLPECSVLSYIERTKGVNCALCDDWIEADQHFTEALRRLPTNSSAHYLHGMYLDQQGRYDEAAECHQRSIALDPDFRCPMMALAQCFTHLGHYEDAVSACMVCLHRQPDAPVAQHAMAQAIYQRLRNGWQGPESEVQELRRKALACLEIAKAGLPLRWSQVEEEMVAYLQSDKGHEELPEQPVKVWKQYGWRP
mmetsp:Transcript_120345/g.212822  ORF Transcript_120345/g.212822 Transcript_120345/m.212822 type:complete len:641 (-) Transcript_120345:41-1963(-)